jgi:DNA-binding Lrp family transcriptional regulator
MNRLNETEETRQFIGAILEEDGRASTSEIRRRTDLTEGQIHHQYRKLERHGLIEIKRSEIPSQSGARMKIAVIPQNKRREAKSLVTHDRQPKRTTVDVVELAENVEAMAESIEQVQEYVSENVYRHLAMMRWSLARVELALEDASVDLDSLNGVDAREEELKQRAKGVTPRD